LQGQRLLTGNLLRPFLSALALPTPAFSGREFPFPTARVEPRPGPCPARPLGHCSSPPRPRAWTSALLLPGPGVQGFRAFAFCHGLMFGRGFCASSSLPRRGSWWSFCSEFSSYFQVLRFRVCIRVAWRERCVGCGFLTVHDKGGEGREGGEGHESGITGDIGQASTLKHGCHKGRFWMKITIRTCVDVVRTSARIRVYPADTVLPTEGFLPSARTH
jgi:hypothetical protein